MSGKGFDLASLSIDKDKANHGTWMEFAGDAKVKVARFNNSAMEEWLIERRASRRFDQGVKTQTNDLRLAVSKFVLLDWTELYLNEVLVPYSEEKALEIYKDYPDFFETIMLMSREREAFKAEAVKAAAGNSKSSSSGK